MAQQTPQRSFRAGSEMQMMGGATNNRMRNSSFRSPSPAAGGGGGGMMFSGASPAPRMPQLLDDDEIIMHNSNNNNGATPIVVATLRDGSRGGGGGAGGGNDGRDSPSFLDTIADRLSTAQRSVSRAWTTFAAEHFPDTPPPLEELPNMQKIEAAKPPTRPPGLPPLAAGQNNNNTNKNNNNNNPATATTSNQPKINYRKWLKKKLKAQQMLENNNNGDGSSSNFFSSAVSSITSLARGESTSRPLDFENKNNKGAASSSSNTTSGTYSSLSSLFRFQSEAATNNNNNNDNPSRHNSSSDDDDNDHNDELGLLFFDQTSQQAYNARRRLNNQNEMNINDDAAVQKTVDELKKNVVDKRYWDPNFDATRAELTSFPANLTEKDAPRELRMLDLLSKDRSAQGRAVDRVLKRRLLENYPVFSEGMNRIQEVNTDLEATAAGCRKARADLDHLKKTFILNGLKIPRLAQRKDRMQDVLSVLEALELMYLRDREMSQLIRECRFHDALDLSENGDSFLFDGIPLVQFLKGVKAAEKLEENWKQMKSSLGKLADAAWDQCFTRGKFDEERYEGIFETHALLGKNGNNNNSVSPVNGSGSVNRSINNNNNNNEPDPKRVAQVVGQSIKDSIHFGLMAASSARNLTDIREVVIGLESPLIVITVCQMAARLADAIAICLRVERFHSERSKEPEEIPPSTEAGGAPPLPSSSPRSSLPPLNLGSLLSRSSSVAPSQSDLDSSNVNFTAQLQHHSASRRIGAGSGRPVGHQRSNSTSLPRASSVSSIMNSPRVQTNNNNGMMMMPPSSHHFSQPRNHQIQLQHHSHQRHTSITNQDEERLREQQELDYQKQQQEQAKRIRQLHRDSLYHLRQDMPKIGFAVQQELRNVAAILALESENFKLLPIDSALHVFYILAMAVECTTHLNPDAFATRAARDNLRVFAKEIVKEQVFHPGCRRIIASLVEENWKPIPNRSAAVAENNSNSPIHQDLDIVTGITPKEYQQDRTAVKNFVTGTSASLENNPFLQPHMVDQRKDALDCLDTVKARLNPYRNTVTASVVRAARLYFEITCRIVVRFPPLAAEVAEWNCDVYSMYLYVIAATMVGVSRTEKLELHYDFHPKARTIIGEAEKWASNLYDLSFRNQSMVVRVSSGGGGVGSNSNVLSPGAGDNNSRAPFHFEQMPSTNNAYATPSRGANLGGPNNNEMPTMTLAQLQAQQRNSNSNFSANNINNNDVGAMNGLLTNDSITNNNSSYQHSFLGRGIIEIKLSEDFPPPVYAGIHTAYESIDHLFAASERLNAIEGCYSLLEVLKQSVESVKEVVAKPVTHAAMERIDRLSVATDAILHVGCHRLCHALFPVGLLTDDISDSRWDTQHVTLLSSVVYNDNNNPGAASTSSAPRSYQLSPDFKYGEWTSLLQKRCQNFFVNHAPKLKLSSAHLRTAYWRHFVFNIQRAIVTGFARSGRASEIVVAAMKAETEFIHKYLKKLFPNPPSAADNNSNSKTVGAFVRENHVFSFLDAYSLDLNGRIRWIKDNHEYYNSEDLTRWFMNLNSASIARHHMEQLLRELKHSDCVPVELFVEVENREEGR